MMNCTEIETNDAPCLVEAREAAVLLQFHFRAESRRLCPKDWAMQDDLRQEMALAVLRYGEPQSLCFFKDLGRKRAINFWHAWKRKSEVPYGVPTAMRSIEVIEEKCQSEQDEEDRERRLKELEDQHQLMILNSVYVRPYRVRRQGECA